MVTHFENHWDNVDESKYPLNFIAKEVLEKIEPKKEYETVFIKISADKKKLVKTWRGKIEIIDKNKNVSFKIKNLKETVFDKKSFLNWNRPGWYELNGKNEEYEVVKFLENKLMNENNYHKFENEVSNLLKLMGINNICVFEPNNQAGKADGFFSVSGLSVIYDATLNENLEYKNEQIKNYIRKIEQESEIECKNIKFKIFEDKEIWLITKQESKIIDRKSIGAYEIRVKIVNVLDLLKILKEKLKKVSFTEKELKAKLVRIGE
jgi:hypothetical protein